VSGSNDAKIKIWSATTGECLRTLAGHTELVRALAFDPESGRLVTASYDMSVRVWDVRTGRLVREFLRHQNSHILDVKFDTKKIIRYVPFPCGFIRLRR
jgi:F-box and WD-40 domain protein 1/11